MGQNGIELLEDRVHLDGHVLGIEYLAGAQRNSPTDPAVSGTRPTWPRTPYWPSRSRRARCRARCSSRVGSIASFSSARPSGCLVDGGHRADLRAVQLHLRAGTHEQAGAIGHHGDGYRRREVAAELGSRQRRRPPIRRGRTRFRRPAGDSSLRRSRGRRRPRPARLRSRRSTVASSNLRRRSIGLP